MGGVMGGVNGEEGGVGRTGGGTLCMFEGGGCGAGGFSFSTTGGGDVGGMEIGGKGAGPLSRDVLRCCEGSPTSVGFLSCVVINCRISICHLLSY